MSLRRFSGSKGQVVPCLWGGLTALQEPRRFPSSRRWSIPAHERCLKPSGLEPTGRHPYRDTAKPDHVLGRASQVNLSGLLLALYDKA